MGVYAKGVVFAIVLAGTLNLVFADQEKRQRFFTEPKDLNIRLNETAKMNCAVQYKEGELQWIGSDGFSVFNENYPEHITEGFDIEYSKVDEIESYNLIIKNVNYPHNGNYQCQVANSNNNYNDAIRSRYAKLTVHHFFQKPKILNASLQAIWPDQEIVCRCGAIPAPRIRWMDDATHEYSEYATSSTDCISINDRSNLSIPLEICVTTSTLKLPMSVFRNHLELRLDCLAFNDEFESEFIMLSSMRLYLEFAPDETRILPGYALEGRSARYICETNGSPRNFTFEWYIGMELKLKENVSRRRSVLQISNVTRSLDSVDLACRVRHKLGESKTWTAIKVIRGRFGTNAPVLPVVGSVNETVLLTCGQSDADFPLPNVTWYFQTLDHVAGTGFQIYKLISEKTAGRYLCESLIDGVGVRKELWVLLQGQPNIFKLDEFVSSDSTSITVRCVIHATPKPNITWIMSNGLRIVYDGSNSRVKVRNIPTHLGVLSTIFISEVLQEDFGDYSCIASNEFGSVNKTVTVSNRGSSVIANLKILAVIFFVVVIGIYAGLIILWIVRCFRKMSSKSKHTTEPFCNLEEKDCNVSDIEVVRKGDDYGNPVLVVPDLPRMSIIEVLEEIEKCSLVNISGSTDGDICSSEASFASTIQISDSEMSTVM